MNRLKGQRRSGTVQICKVNLYILKPAVMLENLTLFHTFTMTTFHIFQLSSCSAGFFSSIQEVGRWSWEACLHEPARSGLSREQSAYRTAIWVISLSPWAPGLFSSSVFGLLFQTKDTKTHVYTQPSIKHTTG